MSKVYFISDLHFGHRRITEFVPGARSGRNCTENMQNIINNWNAVVKKRDFVWVLGDIAMSKEGFDALGELAGTKYMVKGNHDNRFTTEEWLRHFKSVESLVSYKGYWLSHCPIHPAELRGKKNIHGHVHTQSIVAPVDYNEERFWDRNYINICCEAINETPVSFDDIKGGAYWERKRY